MLKRIHFEYPYDKITYILFRLRWASLIDFARLVRFRERLGAVWDVRPIFVMVLTRRTYFTNIILFSIKKYYKQNKQKHLVYNKILKKKYAFQTLKTMQKGLLMCSLRRKETTTDEVRQGSEVLADLATDFCRQNR